MIIPGEGNCFFLGPVAMVLSFGYTLECCGKINNSQCPDDISDQLTQISGRGILASAPLVILMHS